MDVLAKPSERIKKSPGVRWDAKRGKWFIDYYNGHVVEWDKDKN